MPIYQKGKTAFHTLYSVEVPLAAVTALSHFGYDKLCTPGFWDFFYAILCRSSQALPGWMRTVSGQPFSGISRDDQLGSSKGYGSATKGYSQSDRITVNLTSWPRICIVNYDILYRQFPTFGGMFF